MCVEGKAQRKTEVRGPVLEAGAISQGNVISMAGVEMERKQILQPVQRKNYKDRRLNIREKRRGRVKGNLFINF